MTQIAGQSGIGFAIVPHTAYTVVVIFREVATRAISECAGI
ncbi:MAG: hypothetical protein U0T72_08990 [Chitinophagales bacterium]